MSKSDLRALIESIAADAPVTKIASKCRMSDIRREAFFKRAAALQSEA